MDITVAYKYCERIAKNHYENFPVASFLIPKEKRKFIYAIYSFAREADDIADSDSLSQTEKIFLLNDYEKLLKDNVTEYVSTKYDAIFTSLKDTIENLKIPEIELIKLLNAFRFDVYNELHPDFKSLLDYSENSANPIGRLMLYINGFNPSEHKKHFELSDKICTALQLTNFWQDVSRDLKTGRIYIPINIMNKYDYTLDDLKIRKYNDNFRSMVNDLCVKTMQLYEDGSDLLNMLEGRLKYEIKAIYLGGTGVLKKIKEIDFDVINYRVKFNDLEKVFLLFKSFLCRVK
jgi:phytoene synthase